MTWALTIGFLLLVVSGYFYNLRRRRYKPMDPAIQELKRQLREETRTDKE